MRYSYQQRNTGVSNTCSFKDFINNHLDHPFMDSQLSWLSNRDNKIALDFVGRFENLSNDFNYVCEQLGIEDRFLPKNLASKQNYYTYIDFYDSKTKEKVAKKHEKEIDLSKYTFKK